MGCAQGRLTYMTEGKTYHFDDLRLLQAVSEEGMPSKIDDGALQ